MHGAKGDEELVHASLAGELRAFEALVHRYQNPVYWMITGYVREGEAARSLEDLAQQAGGPVIFSVTFSRFLLSYY